MVSFILLQMYNSTITLPCSKTKEVINMHSCDGLHKNVRIIVCLAQKVGLGYCVDCDEDFFNKISKIMKQS